MSGKTYNGKNVNQWAAHLGITQPSFSNRLRKHDGDFAAAIAMGGKNKRGSNGKLYTHNGKTQGLKEWAAEVGVARSFLYYRTGKHGFAEAITMRPSAAASKAKKYTAQGQTLTVRQWADKLGINVQAMHSRINYTGIERAVARLAPVKKTIKRREQPLVLRIGIKRQQIICVGSGQALSDLVNCFVCETACSLRDLLV